MNPLDKRKPRRIVCDQVTCPALWDTGFEPESCPIESKICGRELVCTLGSLIEKGKEQTDAADLLTVILARTTLNEVRLIELCKVCWNYFPGRRTYFKELEKFVKETSQRKIIQTLYIANGWVERRLKKLKKDRKPHEPA